MSYKELPPQSELNKIFRYDPENGKLYWRVRKAYRIKIGDEVGCNSNGYLIAGIGGLLYMTHRIIWKMVYDSDPVQIDHIDHDRKNNRIDNLRSVTNQENQKNRKINKNNSSGAVGISWHNRDKKWQAYISVAKKLKHLGFFDSKEKAVSARASAEIKYGYHENHGNI